MEVFKLFRALILACFALLIVTLGASFFAAAPPEEVGAYLDATAGPMPGVFLHGSTFTQLLLGLVLLAYLAAWLASLFGLLAYKAWARTLFIATTVLGFLIWPFTGTTLSSPLEGTLDTLLSMCDGAVLVLLFVEPIRGRFQSRATA